MSRRPLLALAGVALAALALSGCATDTADPAGSAPDASSGFSAGAAWLAGGSLIAVVTEGSSTPTCAPFVDDVVLDEGVLVVALTENPDAGDGCDGDAVKRATVVGTPAGLDPADGVEVQVSLGDEFAEATLAPYAGGAVDEYTPSAGWVDDGVVALMTWGSSSCAPVVESAKAETPQSVVVTFVEQSADQPCTMDMAPRVAVTTVDGEVSRDATLTVAEGTGLVPAMSIPIY